MTTSQLAPWVAAEVRAEMARNNVTAAALAMRVGRPKQTVHRWTSGETALSLDDLEMVCDALGLALPDVVSAAVRRRHVPRVDAAQSRAA